MYGAAPKPVFIHYSQIIKKDASNSCIISLHNHTGTHIDAPKHFIDTGKSISDYSIEELIFRNPIIVDCPKNCAELITPDDLRPVLHQLEKCDCLILHTGYGKFRNEEKYRTNNPGIAPETISWIRKEFPNIRCIGFDSISISSFQHRNEGREAHKAAFAQKNSLGVPLLLIEDMNLEVLSSNEILKKVIVIPWQIKGIDSAPCTVLAEVE
jgi:kynurenine formamidase